MVRTIVLCILDGWGVAPRGAHNAITGADPKFFNHLLSNYPSTTLTTSGNCVGLPHGQMGNSEVGHMTIGSGRIIEQDLVRINNELKSGALYKRLEQIQISSTCHIIGLASDGGVHSHIDHLLAIANFIDPNIDVKLHLITDGRDTSPRSAMNFVKYINESIKRSPNVSISTISGRHYAMDRDDRKERTARTLETIAGGTNKTFDDALSAIDFSYKNNVYDEFIEPQSSRCYNGINEGDTIICTNFRADRMRQLTSALFGLCSQTTKIIMAPYSEEVNKNSTILFTPITIANNLGEILSKHNIHQLRIAETEKYAHITFFFNSGREAPYNLEKRILVESPKVATYDLCPEMSANEMTDILEKEVLSNKHQFILVNYANADMVGHTGNYAATCTAIKTLDKCLKRLYQAINAVGGSLIITADHGNAESMFDNDSQLSHTAHTTNPVPFIIASANLQNKKVKLAKGTLADITPTILSMYGIEIPAEMTGKNLVKPEKVLTGTT